MRPLLSIAVVALLALGMVWLWRGGDDRATRAVPLPQAESAARDDALRALADAAAPRDERVGVEAGGPAEPHEQEVAGTVEQPAGRRVRVRYVDAGDGEPLPGFELEFSRRFSRSRESVAGTTDAAGECEVRLEPGEHLALQRARPGAAAGVARDLSPQVFEVPEGDPEEPFPVTLRGRAPPAVLELVVVHTDGTPAVDAWAQFVCRVEDEPFVDPRTRTDEAGRAWVGVWDPEGFTDGLASAWDEEHNASELLPVEAPLAPGPRRLVLAPAARVEVLVRDAEQEPVVERRVLLASQVPGGPRRYDVTDGEGRYVFEGVFPGAYAVGARSVSTDRYEFELLTLARGERRTIEIALPDVARQPALTGFVVDEDGAPLEGAALIVQPSNADPRGVRSDAQGAFAAYADPCDSLRVLANAWSEGDVFEPASVEVAWGTRDLRFQRVRRAEERRFEVEVVDRATGREVEHFVATIDRGPDHARWSNSYAPRREFELRVLPETRWRVASRGYLVAQLQLLDELDRLAPGERLRVELDVGLEHDLAVLDADTGAPLEGVLLRSQGGDAFTTDALGLARIRSPQWSTYTATRDGYRPVEWDPEDHVLWDFGPLILERDAGAEGDGR